MARKPDVQYVQFQYISGSAAEKLQPLKLPKRNKTVLPEALPEKKIVIGVDPVAVCGLVVACVMLVMLLVGLGQFQTAVTQRQEMERYVSTLHEDNIILEQEYHAGYDPTVIRETALALGMVPVEQLQSITIRVDVPQPEPEPTAWESFVIFCEGLFA